MQKEHIGIDDARGKKIYEGDMYFEETERDEGDVRIFFVVTWLKEWATYSLLSIGEFLDYEDNGIEALDESDRNTFVIDAKEFKRLHYKGNVIDDAPLLKITNQSPDYE